jgi:hypothetical protein
MKFEITEAEAREMAKFEEEVGCDVSAGPDWGIHLDKVIDFVLEQTSSNTAIDSEECEFSDLKIPLFPNQRNHLANATNDCQGD